jgi:molecular chaperone GrpE
MSDLTSEQDSEAQPPGPVPQGPPPTDTDSSDAPAPDEYDEPELDEAPSSEISDEERLEDELSDIEAQLLDDMDRLQSERNDYLDQLLRTRADFDNYRKRILKQQSEHQERAAEALVEKLLEALDTFDMAVAHGQGFEQVRDMLVTILTKEGLERIDPAGEQFDPNESDAVAHEDGDGGPVVAEVLRPGYRWKGRVLRPAMVKVRG